MTLVGLPMYFVRKGAVQDIDHYEASLVPGAEHFRRHDRLVLVLEKLSLSVSGAALLAACA